MFIYTEIMSDGNRDNTGDMNVTNCILQTVAYLACSVEGSMSSSLGSSISSTPSSELIAGVGAYLITLKDTGTSLDRKGTQAIYVRIHFNNNGVY